MKICNCPERCFKDVNQFGFLKNDLIKSEYYPEGCTEILIYSPDLDRSFFSYEPKTQYHNSIRNETLCDEGVSELIGMCIFARDNIEILYLNGNTKPMPACEFYYSEEFKSLIRNNKIEAIIQ